MNFWCEVDKSKLKSNIERIKEMVGDKKVVAVVKGNAYGLGIEDISSIIEKDIDIFGVASLDEAMTLNTKKDILIMSPLCSTPSIQDNKNNYIYTIDSAIDLSNFSPHSRWRVHVYIDTGMNRLGIAHYNTISFVNNIIKNYPHITVEGLYTHLQNAGDIESTKAQINLFRDICENFIGKIPHFHCLNSKAITSHDLVRAASFTTIARTGNLLYGYDGLTQGIQKVFKIRAKVVKSYFVDSNGTIGYGSKFKVKAGTTVGVLHCGTIDKIGFKKDVSSSILKDCLKIIKNSFTKPTFIYYEGKPLKLLCAPNMNCTLIDISNINVPERTDIIVDINISSILIDSSVMRVYL